MNKYLAGVALLGAVLSTHAATIAINSTASGNVDWNSAIWGDPAAVPTSGNDYVHDGSVSANLLGLGATHGGFAGDSLTLDSGAVLFNKGGGALGATLILNGGQWQTRSAGTAVVSGGVHVETTSRILLVDGSMQLDAGLSSSSNAVLEIGNFTQSGRSFLMNAADNGFTGTFEVRDTGSAAQTWTIQFDQNYTNATLKLTGGKNDPTYAAIYQLAGDNYFEEVIMPDGSGGLVNLGAGTYDGAALLSAGVSSDYFNDLGGTISAGVPVPFEGIPINPSTPTGTNISWNAAIWGDPAVVPTSINDYIYDKSGVWLNALGSHGAFDGKSLTAKSSAGIFVRGGGSLGGRLRLDGGQLQNRSGINAVILGNVEVPSQSTVLNISGNLEFRTSLEGAGWLDISAFQVDGQKVFINSTDMGYVGTFNLKNAGADNVRLAVEFGKNFNSAGLAFQGGNLLRAPVYQLTNSIAFQSVSMPSASNPSVMVDLAPGSYNGAALAAAGVNTNYYADLGGTLNVGLSGYDLWAGSWGVEIGAGTDDYDGDGYANLMEYALGGDPTNSADRGLVPTFDVDAGTLTYVHAQQKGNTNLAYYLETNTDLVYGTWTNSGYSVLATNVMPGGGFDYVTNAVPTTAAKTFVRLTVESD